MSIILEDRDRFDDELNGETSDLIDLKDFVSFILTPLAAALVIADDMDVDTDEAHDIRDTNNEFGDIMQPDDDNDDLLDTLHQENIQAMKGTTNIFFSTTIPSSKTDRGNVIYRRCPQAQ